MRAPRLHTRHRDRGDQATRSAPRVRPLRAPGADASASAVGTVDAADGAALHGTDIGTAVARAAQRSALRVAGLPRRDVPAPDTTLRDPPASLAAIADAATLDTTDQHLRFPAVQASRICHPDDPGRMELDDQPPQRRRRRRAPIPKRVRMRKQVGGDLVAHPGRRRRPHDRRPSDLRADRRLGPHDRVDRPVQRAVLVAQPAPTPRNPTIRPRVQARLAQLAALARHATRDGHGVGGFSASTIRARTGRRPTASKPHAHPQTSPATGTAKPAGCSRP
jgi:hypothetical protein